MDASVFNSAVLNRIDNNVKKLLINQGAMMTTLSDLTTSIATLQAADMQIQASDLAVEDAIKTAIALITSLQAGGTVSDAEVEAAVMSLNTVSGDLTKASNDFSAAVTGLAGADAPAVGVSPPVPVAKVTRDVRPAMAAPVMPEHKPAMGHKPVPKGPAHNKMHEDHE